MDTVVSVESLSKSYRLGQISAQTFRDDAARWWARLRGQPDPLTMIGHERVRGRESIWALRDVNFEVKQGEVLGIIGKNGAGKSTLLKILSRTTAPTSGLVKVRGRLASLLEVGTGFHPELTGRDNIYLNGAILGMGRAEVRRKFDEIVAFSEVEQFIDTPVKRYSSGMYVRLAFAVAAHLNPEILIVDEVLAVGDIQFQRKCIGRMEGAAREGSTVMLVSHSMSTVKALCSRAILLDKGQIVAAGAADGVISRYLSVGTLASAVQAISEADHVGGVRQLRVRTVRLLDGVEGTLTVYWQQEIRLQIQMQVYERIPRLAIGAGFRALDGTHILTVHQDDDGQQDLWDLEVGDYLVEVALANDLRPGVYKLDVGGDLEHLMMKNVFDVRDLVFEVLGHAKDGRIPEPSNTGLMNGRSRWTVERIPDASRGPAASTPITRT